MFDNCVIDNQKNVICNTRDRGIALACYYVNTKEVLTELACYYDGHDGSSPYFVDNSFLQSTSPLTSLTSLTSPTSSGSTKSPTNSTSSGSHIEVQIKIVILIICMLFI